VAITHKVFTSRNNNLDQATYVGEAGRLFYAQTTSTGHAPVLKYSDGVTVGGLPLSGGSLTFSSDTPPLNPSEGNLWWNTTDGRLYIYYDASWVDASPDITNTATDVTLTLLSVSTSTAVDGGALSYNNQSGVFTYTPPNLSGYLTTVTNVAYANTATTATNAAYAYSFNTGTLVTTAVTANTVAGGYVRSITAGTGTAVSTSTGDVTVWAVPIITSTGSTTATDYTIDMSGPSFVHWQPSANGDRNITLSNFTPDRKVEVFITPHRVQDIFTVTNVTPSQCSNNKNNFSASAQTSFMLQIYSTTSDVGGVWIFGSSSV